MRFVRGIGILLVLLVFNPVGAVEIAGITLPDSAQVGDATLELNGAGIRKKLIIKVYVGALYLSETSQSAETIFADNGPKRVLLHFLYKKVSADKLVDAWNDGFEGNLSASEHTSLGDRIEQFNALFPDAKKGDVFTLDYVPGDGTSVTVNGQRKGVIPGEDFNRALLKIWLGDKPATSSLKKAMLGG